ncbi:MAG: NAD(P)/FAD-dependent oxidoreductase [Candidatus Dojkabacteria bacterium]
MSLSDKKITIIGGGILGLSTAYFLAKKGADVTVLEKNSDWGGLASGIPIADTTIEKYYHHWFRSDTEIQELIKELGLAEKLRWIPSKVGLYYKGKIYGFSTGLDLLKFPHLSIFDRLRSGVVTFFLQKIKSYKRFDKISAIDWCRKYFGKRATSVIWEPLLRGKFGDAYDKVAMTWLWARIHDRSSSRSNPLANEKLGYLDGGFQLFIDTLVDKLRELNVKFISKAEITDHSYKNKKHKIDYRVKGSKNNTPSEITSDKIIATVPGPVFTKLFDVSAETRKRINSMKYLGATTLLLVLKKSMMPYYWLNVNDLSFPFLVMVEHTNFVDKRFYNDQIILYIAKYIDPEKPLFNKSKKELIDEYEGYLRKINPEFSKEWIKESFLFKSAFAQHIVTTDYRRPEYQTDIPGLYLANFSQIHPHDRGTNYSVAQARELLKLI